MLYVADCGAFAKRRRSYKKRVRSVFLSAYGFFYGFRRAKFFYACVNRNFLVFSKLFCGAYK